MVERLKIAVAKARAQRARAISSGEQAVAVAPGVAEQPPAPSPAPAAAAAPAPAEAYTGLDRARSETLHPAGRPRAVPSDAPDRTIWRNLEEVGLDASHLERNRIISAAKQDPSHVAFDVLRTRILREFRKRGWSHVGITSPTEGCGKTFVSANLALSLARQEEVYTILFDMDLRAPSIAKVLGHKNPRSVNSFLSGHVKAEDYLKRHGPNLAIGFNARRIDGAAEAILSQSTSDVLTSMTDTYRPDIVIYDLPPMLVCDDVLGFLPHLDCVLLIAGGGITMADQIRDCERMLADQTNLLGVLLNRAEVTNANQYGYYYGYGYGKDPQD